ncbi:MAG: DUF2867 domain-containing protein [Desulfohalobiaceae bacterium]
MSEEPKVLVTGATGYVGGRLIPRLLQAGYKVRAVARNRAKLASKSWAEEPGLELFQADALDPESMQRACQGCFAAYYLIHSMHPGNKDFANTDSKAAEIMVWAAAQNSLRQVIYLGGLGEETDHLSPHLRSRLQVAKTLQAGRVPVTFLRAAIILGSGSASFEILRYLCERLPVMTTPGWIRTRCQPIAIRNVLGYLLGSLDNPQCIGRTLDIGGPEILTYARLFDIYCKVAGLRRRILIPLPILSPKISSWWVHLVTPVPAAIAMPLVEGLQNEVVCRDNSIQEIISQDLLTAEQAIQTALQRLSQEQVETSWTDAGELKPPEWCMSGDAPYAGGTIMECGYKVGVRTSPEQVFKPISRIGGSTGWYFGNFLWYLRGEMDRLVGGVGLRRGRRHPEQIQIGDALDFWRVIQIERPWLLRLLAEMKTPGQAILELRINTVPSQDPQARECELVLLSRFLPKGLWGIIYWYLNLPMHRLIFKGMARNIAKASGGELIHPPLPHNEQSSVCLIQKS